MAHLLRLPEDALRNVASFLCAPDLLHFLSAHSHLHQVSKSESFWWSLMNENMRNDDAPGTDPSSSAKRAYLTRAYVQDMPMVHWTLCRSSNTSPTGREGHVAVTLGKRILITGGFTDDARLYVMDVSRGTAPTNPSDWQRVVPTHVRSWRHPELPPPHPSQLRRLPNQQPPGGMPLPEGELGLASVYGASLTALDDTRAIRFGGFCGGGYSEE
jgi:hypothetical protein